jgi:hypothetical protein
MRLHVIWTTPTSCIIFEAVALSVLLLELAIYRVTYP